MPGTIHAFEFLKSPSIENWGGLIPVFGTDRYLRKRVVDRMVNMLQSGGQLPDQVDGSDDEDPVAHYFDGEQAVWSDINDELATFSLFHSDVRIAVVNNADNFVKDHRDQIEKWLSKEQQHGCLIICIDSWPANTRLFKQCDKSSIQVDVGPPKSKKGRSKSRDDKKIASWIREHAESQYQLKMSAACAAQVIDLLEDDFGRIDQELAKISLIKPAGEKPTPADIVEIIGGWKAKSIWQAVDHIADGDIDQALTLLNRLLQSGEHPLALYGQLSWSLRRYGQACEFYLVAQRNDRPIALRDALQQAGFRPWGGELENAERRMKRMGRATAGKLNQWLLETDLALKGSHSPDSRARFALEMLFLKLGAAQA